MVSDIPSGDGKIANPFFYSARTDLSSGGIVLGPFVVAGLQTDGVRTVRMQGVGIHIPGGDTLALALYTPYAHV